MFKKKMRELQKNPAFVWTLDIVITIFGSFLFAFGTHCFTAPNHMAPGGMVGIATIVNFLSGIPIGTFSVVLNIPLMILGFWKLGRRFMIKTLISLFAYSFALDFLFINLPTYTNNVLVACIFGGVLMGAGLGMVMSRGGSTGGMDIINKLILRRFPHMKFGRIQFTTDAVIVLGSVFAYGNIEVALLALICLYITAIVLDAVLYGANTCKLIYITSQRPGEICKRIHTEMDRGATILHAQGSYTGENRPTIMVAVRQNEYYHLRRIIRETDPGSFVIMASASEIFGQGFEESA